VPEKNKIDERFRAQADRLEPIVVSWNEVGEEARRKRWIQMLGLVAATVLAALLLAGILLAARTALDPTFQPPLFSGASTNTHVREPTLGRGLISEAEFLASGGGTATTSRAAAQRLGFPVVAKVKTTDSQGEELLPRWTLRRAGGLVARRKVTKALGATAIEPTSRSEVRRLRAWVPAPRHSGLYVAELTLLSPGHGVIERSRSKPFEVIADDCCAAYQTPSYRAVLPRGWRLKSDYQAAAGGRFVSEVAGPSGIFMLIDTTPHSTGDALASQRALERQLAGSRERYRRIGVNQIGDRGGAVIEWTYWVEGETNTDELFYRGGSGFGIRGVSPPSHFRETREFCRKVEEALRTRLEGSSGR
jgi:hypothetical protein